MSWLITDRRLEMLKELKEIIKHPYDLTENYHLFNEFITFDGKWIQPKHKWGGRKPKICVFVDVPNQPGSFVIDIS